ncbi:MAG: Gfo/Idh/MocA family oxidoreductase [Clostridia bacterium]|nr:Gfo/Idh/MocA family oxidoreductase [Clostridia bacterium]
MEKKKLVILGFGQRGRGYASFAKNNPEKFEIAAVIDTDKERLDEAKAEYPAAGVYADYKDFIKDKVRADMVAVCTQDEQHKEHAIAMMAAGYDLLLEKPIANNRKDCEEIYKASIKYGRKVIVCHVLRYSPFYSAVKKVIDSGELGEIITINASENVGYWHQSHSFVRGPWRNKEQSSPMILAKCCHDMDIIRYLMGEKCVSVNSYGSLYYFNKDHAPDGSTEYCSACPHSETCLWNAQRLYTTEEYGWTVGYFGKVGSSKEEILRDLKGTQYDKCVFHNDNDVVDHEVTIMQFANGKTACHTMTAFSKNVYRDLKVHGTKAELYGSMEDNCFEIRYFGKDTKKVTIDLSNVNSGSHNGGDYCMMSSLYENLNGEKAEGITYLDVSLESHLMSFAAEESRLRNGKTIKIKTK